MQKTSEVYGSLYHYTTLQGAIGIIQSQSLWGTHYKFLNDSSERILIKEKLVEHLYPHMLQKYQEYVKKNPQVKAQLDAGGGLAKITMEDARIFVDVQYRVTGDEIYITSFCGETKDAYVNENGLLSQWRGYGREGGISILLNTKKLEEILELEGSKFGYSHLAMADLIYSHDDKKYEEELTGYLSDLSEYAAKMAEKVVSKKGDVPSAMRAYPAFLQCTSRYKHRGFQEENEVRIIAVPVVHDKDYLDLAGATRQKINLEKPRNFREKAGEQVPYIELFKTEDIILPIEKIIVGPHKEKEARASALKVMLRNTDIEVVTSEIPYIG